MKYLLGIDFGGGSSKATLLSTEGDIVAESVAEYPMLYPTVSACEQMPDDWISALKLNISSLINDNGINPADILCIAIDSATHTFVICDECFKPIRPAIHWTDSRSKEQSERLNNTFGDDIYKITNHRPDTVWTLPQLIWLMENEPENFAKTKHIMFEKDYIRLFLTNVFCTDYIEAQGSMLFDCKENRWSDKLCNIAGISADMLPPIKKPTDIIGTVTTTAAELTGLKEGTPVICGTTDTAMEILASGAVEVGDMTVKLATAGRICVISDRAYPDKHLVNYSHICDGLWYPGTAVKSAASCYRWFRDTFDGNYRDLDREASKIPVGSDGLYFHPYINGEMTPYADPMLCGSFTGVRAGHTKAYFTRAVLEGVSLALLDSKAYLETLNIPHNQIATLIGGGAKGELWQQITADVLGITLRVTESSDSSLGSAMLAGIAVGVFADAKDAVGCCVKQVKLIHPNPQNNAKYKEIFSVYKKIHDALAPIYRER